MRASGAGHTLRGPRKTEEALGWKTKQFNYVQLMKHVHDRTSICISICSQTQGPWHNYWNNSISGAILARFCGFWEGNSMQMTRTLLTSPAHSFHVDYTFPFPARSTKCSTFFKIIFFTRNKNKILLDSGKCTRTEGRQECS